MNVLSLFDGISCGQLALGRANKKVDNYFASEIKDIAIKTTQKHFPNTIQLGDITKIDGTKLPKIDLLIGGSPCQDFSQANKNRNGLKGSKSSLFFHYIRLLKEVKPKYFLLENVVMKKDQEDMITSLLGVNPIKINSCLLSAQNRNRLYWTNIPNITLPTDKGILLDSILENGYTPLLKSRCLMLGDSRPLRTPVKMFHRYYRKGFTTLVFRDQKHYKRCKAHYDANYSGLLAKDIVCDSDIYDGVRYLNRTERERLQTVPEGYCDLLTENEAADVLGDGWTVDVIAHIFSYII